MDEFIRYPWGNIDLRNLSFFQVSLKFHSMKKNLRISQVEYISSINHQTRNNRDKT